MRKLALPRTLSLLFSATMMISAVRGDDWPQWLGPHRDGIWRETGILEKFPSGGPKVLWRTHIGAGYAGPAVAGGKVFLLDRILAPGAQNDPNAFARTTVDGDERILCLDATTGKELWKHSYFCKYAISYPSGPRTTPLVAEGKVYALGAMGDLLCLDAATGKVLWSRNFPRDYDAPVQMWGFSSSPLLDGERLICLVGGENSGVVAFHKDSGKELWRAVNTEHIGYCSPVIFDVGGRRQLIAWHGMGVHSLDPETGQVLWELPWRVQAGMAIPTVRLSGDLLFLSCFYNGSVLLQLERDKPGMRVVWKGKAFKGGRGSELPQNTDGLHCVMSTPLIQADYVYGVCSYGQLRCIELKTGQRVWESLAAIVGKEERWGNAFLVPQAERCFLFNEQGDLIIARLTPQGYEEISRANILTPDNSMAPPPGRKVVWSYPAFANRKVFARNDHEIVCVDLAADTR